MNKHYDILIIGAGFAGAATAYHLARSCDLKILILEQETSYGMHASGKNAALLRQAVLACDLAPLIQETLLALKSPPLDWLSPVNYHETGSLLLGKKNQVDALQIQLQSVSAVGEVYEPGQFPKNIPENLKSYLFHADYEAMLWTKSDGVVDVHALLTNYIQAAQHQGAQLKASFPVSEIRQENGRWVVRCPQNEYSAEVLVNAAGAWANSVALSAGLSIPGLASFRRHLYISEMLSWAEKNWPFVWDMHHELYFRSESGGLLLCPGDEELHPASDPQTNPRMIELLAEKLVAHFPALAKVSIRQAWACLRTKIPGGDFFIDWDPHADGFFWVAALGGHGMSSSMGVGRIAAERIIDYFVRQKDLSSRKT